MAAHLYLATTDREQPPHPIHVVLADDHSVVRRSLRLLLDAETPRGAPSREACVDFGYRGWVNGID